MPSVAMQDKFALPEEAQSIAKILPLVLRRMVRLIIGIISFPAVVEMLRSVYVEEAQKKLLRDGTNPTKSALPDSCPMNEEMYLAFLNAPSTFGFC